MTSTLQYPCCKITMELYGRWQAALYDAEDQSHRQSSSHFMPILDILKQVVKGDPTIKSKMSITSTTNVNGLPDAGLINLFGLDPVSLETGVQDSDIESDITTRETKYMNGPGSQYSPIIQGLSASGLSSPYIPVIHNKDNIYKSYTLGEYTHKDQTDSSILGLSAAGLNAPFDPTGSNDLKLLRVRTRSALLCLRRHLLPASKTQKTYIKF